MALTRTQAGVAAGMTGGALPTAAAFVSPRLPTVSPGPQVRFGVWLACSLVSAAWLMIGVARLAAHRLFAAADIDGGGILANTAKAALLQALVQNSLEQVVLAVVATGAWLALGPPGRAGLAVIFTGYFAVGRSLFFAGYSRGAAARPPGFTLTFYPSVALFVALLPAALMQLVPV